VTPLVVGVGQPLAGDDGVGWEVVQRLASEGLATAWAPDGAALVTLLCGVTRAVVIDAAVGVGPPGTVLVLGAGDLPAGRHPTSSHGLSVPEAIALARALSSVTVQIVAVAIDPPAAAGVGLSPAVAAALPEAVARVRGLLAPEPAR
jgi:hydrogenase maturation protease